MSSYEPAPRPGGPVRLRRVTVKPTVKGFVASARKAWTWGVKHDLKRLLRPRGVAERENGSTELDATSYAPLEVKETGELYVFDEAGLRLEGSRELALAARWSEFDRVALQVQHSELLGLKLLRLVLWPLHPDAFVAANPGIDKAWDPAVGGFVLALATARRVPERSVHTALSGLWWAGPLFNGQVEDVPASPTP